MLYKNFSIDEFIPELNKKIKKNDEITRGNIELFRSKLREYGLLNNRESLNTQHIDIYMKSYEIKNESNLTWEEAFNHILRELSNKTLVIQELKFDNFACI